MGCVEFGNESIVRLYGILWVILRIVGSKWRVLSSGIGLSRFVFWKDYFVENILE